MDRRKALVSTIALFGGICLPPVIQAASPVKQPAIVLHVKDMHCGDCAKRIAAKLYAVPGVVKVSTDLKKSQAYVTAQKSKIPSSKLLWEAAIAAKLEPVKLVSPQGTFTDRPKR